METGDIVRTQVRVVMHLSAGYTRVMVEETEGVGLADGGVEWDIPTDIIPFNLRSIGTRFLLIRSALTSVEGLNAEHVRRALSEMYVEELPRARIE